MLLANFTVTITVTYM